MPDSDEKPHNGNTLKKRPSSEQNVEASTAQLDSPINLAKGDSPSDPTKTEKPEDSDSSVPLPKPDNRPLHAITGEPLSLLREIT
ncbi:MAG: hypothetical protein Q9213_008372, partial [Squamulea squamosa]